MPKQMTKFHRAVFQLVLLQLCILVMGQSKQSNARVLNDTATIDPLVTTAIEHFEIRGETLSDLKIELAAKGRGASGITSGTVTYRFRSKIVEGICQIEEVRASCSTKVRLPRWENIAYQ